MKKVVKYATPDRKNNVEKVKELRAQGMTIKQVAKKFQLHPSTITRWLFEDKQGTVTPVRGYAPANEQRFQTAMKLLKDGIAREVIAKKIGVSKGTVDNWVRIQKNLAGKRPVRLTQKGKAKGKIAGNGILVVQMDQKGATLGFGGNLCRVQSEDPTNLGRLIRGFLTRGAS